MNKTDEELKAEWLARNGVTVCDTADLRGDTHKDAVLLIQAQNPCKIHRRGAKRPENKKDVWRRWDDKG